MCKQGREAFEVYGSVSGDQELRQGELPFAEDAKGRGHRFASVAFLDNSRRQGMKSGLAIAPQIAHPWHHHREQWTEQLLQVVADEEVLLTWLADHCGRIDGVPAMENPV